MTPVKLWRYVLPSTNGLEGWAEIVICSSGFFAAVSDYGNYAFGWRSMGVDDARKFFISASLDWSYFANKLGGPLSREYDGVATLRAIREEIVRRRRSGEWSRHEARDEWDRADSNIEDAKEWFGIWWAATKIEDAHELQRHCCNVSLEAFCKQTLSRLAEVIRAELAAEAAAA
jgi:hypothetical protein